jgi:hypothetical protein
MTESKDKEIVSSASNKRRWLPWLLLIIAVLYIVWNYQQQQVLREQLTVDQGKLQQMLSELQNEKQQLMKERDRFSKRGDSLNAQLQPYLPMKALMRSVQMRNYVNNELPFKPGDVVRFKTDSLTYVIQDMIIGGNLYSYYIKYRIRRAGAQAIECEIQELEAVK